MISTPSQRLAHMARFMSQPLRLIDGGLSGSSIRDRLVARMANDLVEADAYHCERDAIMLLLHKAYSITNVFLLVGDAVYLAKQNKVAEAMSKP